MKISAKVREEAAVICAEQASQRGPTWTCRRTFAEAMGFTERSLNLAWRAYMFAAASAVYLHGGPSQCEVSHAEAEALLRTGWEP